MKITNGLARRMVGISRRNEAFNRVHILDLGVSPEESAWTLSKPAKMLDRTWLFTSSSNHLPINPYISPMVFCCGKVLCGTMALFSILNRREAGVVYSDGTHMEDVKGKCIYLFSCCLASTQSKACYANS